MKVSGMDAGSNIPAGQLKPVQAEDSVSRNLREQIADAQKQLQDLSSNDKMPAEEKMKKRQELQKQISDLTNQLRQHQLEQRKEQQEKNTVQNDTERKNSTAQSAKEQQKNTGMSKEGMQAMIASEYTLKQAGVQESAAKELKGQTNVLAAEIRLDATRAGTTVKGKQETLAELEQKAQNVQTEQFATLTDANETMKDGTKLDREVKEEAEKEAKKEEQEKQIEKKQEEFRYTPVDIRL